MLESGALPADVVPARFVERLVSAGHWPACIATSIYGIGYLAPGGYATSHGPSREWVDVTMALFLASMSMVVIAAGVVPFLFGWEAMAIVSFFLVIGNGRNESNRRAAFIYAAMSHAGAAFLLMAFLLPGRKHCCMVC